MAKQPAGGKNPLRETNAQIAAAYDEVSYDPEGAPHVDPAYVRPLAAMFGLNTEHDDVLDICCGYGGHTVRMTRASRGRVVGLDISKAGCERARERFAQAGREADIRCVDLMEVKAKDLGQFDLIGCVGALYVTPEPVQAKILELIGECLRPGGACLLSFYTGPSGYAAAELQRIVRTKLGLAEPSEHAVGAGREFLMQIIADMRSLEADSTVLRRAETMAALPDANLFHELFGPSLVNFSPMRLHERLKPHGVQIAGVIPYDLAMLGPDPDTRALSLDILDLMRGGYRYVLFGKWAGEPQPADFDHPSIEWVSGYERHPEAGPDCFRSPLTSLQVTVHEPHLRAFLDALAERPRRWGEAVALARGRVASEQPSAPFDESVLKRDVIQLWQTGDVQPRLPELPHPGFD